MSSVSLPPQTRSTSATTLANSLFQTERRQRCSRLSSKTLDSFRGTSQQRETRTRCRPVRLRNLRPTRIVRRQSQTKYITSLLPSALTLTLFLDSIQKTTLPRRRRRLGRIRTANRSKRRLRQRPHHPARPQLSTRILRNQTRLHLQKPQGTLAHILTQIGSDPRRNIYNQWHGLDLQKARRC